MKYNFLLAAALYIDWTAAIPHATRAEKRGGALAARTLGSSFNDTYAASIDDLIKNAFPSDKDFLDLCDRAQSLKSLNDFDDSARKILAVDKFGLPIVVEKNGALFVPRLLVEAGVRERDDYQKELFEDLGRPESSNDERGSALGRRGLATFRGFDEKPSLEVRILWGGACMAACSASHVVRGAYHTTANLLTLHPLEAAKAVATVPINIGMDAVTYVNHVVNGKDTGFLQGRSEELGSSNSAALIDPKTREMLSQIGIDMFSEPDFVPQPSLANLLDELKSSIADIPELFALHDRLSTQVARLIKENEPEVVFGSYYYKYTQLAPAHSGQLEKGNITSGSTSETQSNFSRFLEVYRALQLEAGEIILPIVKAMLCNSTEPILYAAAQSIYTELTGAPQQFISPFLAGTSAIPALQNKHFDGRAEECFSALIAKANAGTALSPSETTSLTFIYVTETIRQLYTNTYDKAAAALEENGVMQKMLLTGLALSKLAQDTSVLPKGFAVNLVPDTTSTLFTPPQRNV